MQTNSKSVEMRPVARLKAFDRNARTHSKEQIAQLAASIAEFGFTAPILISPDGEIRAGHGRLEAAKFLGMKEVPTIVVGGDWSPEKVRAYVIADNKLALNAGWDFELLAAELGELQGLNFDIALTGFSLDEISALSFEDDNAGAAERSGLRSAGGAGSLMERFGVAPFSVLNAREGWWQERKRAWLALGIRSELGRGENTLGFSETILSGSKKSESAKSAVPGNGGRPASATYRDKRFYDKKRAWEAKYGRKISTAEFREKHWDGGA